MLRFFKHTDSLEDELRKYMLGELTEEEQHHYQKRLLDDDALFREVDGMAERIQDELAEDYISGDLTADRRLAFERSLMPCDSIRQKVALHKALGTLARKNKNQSSWLERLRLWFQPILRPVPAMATALAVAVVGGGSWSVHQLGVLQTQLDEAHLEQAQLRSRVAQSDPDLLVKKALEGVQTLPFPRLASSQGGISSFVLHPGLQRSSGDIERLAIKPNQKIVEFKLDTGLDSHKSYQIVLYNSRGEKLIEQNELKATSAGDSVYIVWELPTTNLPNDDYQIALSGVTAARQVETIDRYYFRLTVE